MGIPVLPGALLPAEDARPVAPAIPCQQTCPRTEGPPGHVGWTGLLADALQGKYNHRSPVTHFPRFINVSNHNSFRSGEEGQPRLPGENRLLSFLLERTPAASGSQRQEGVDTRAWSRHSYLFHLH